MPRNDPTCQRSGARERTATSKTETHKMKPTPAEIEAGKDAVAKLEQIAELTPTGGYGDYISQRLFNAASLIRDAFKNGGIDLSNTKVTCSSPESEAATKGKL
jgi:hypothetical protein